MNYEKQWWRDLSDRVSEEDYNKSYTYDDILASRLKAVSEIKEILFENCLLKDLRDGYEKTKGLADYLYEVSESMKAALESINAWEERFIDVLPPPAEIKKRPCYVYYIYNSYHDRIKIGVSVEPKRRAKELEHAGSDAVEIIKTFKLENEHDARAVESRLHYHFTRHRVTNLNYQKSCEWFNAKIITELKERFWTDEQIQGVLNYHNSEMIKAAEIAQNALKEVG